MYINGHSIQGFKGYTFDPNKYIIVIVVIIIIITIIIIIYRFIF